MNTHKEILSKEDPRIQEEYIAELLATISHELRSPLTSIKGYAATLLRHEQHLSAEERHSFLQAIAERTDQLEAMVNRFLLLTQLESGNYTFHPEPLSSLPLLQRSLQTYANDTAETQRFSLFVADHFREGLLINGDRSLLMLLFQELFDNAIQHTPAGSPILVTLKPGEPLESQPSIEIQIQTKEGFISPEHLHLIFQRFYRVDTSLTRTARGLGVGLALCQHIIYLHQGTIWAESDPHSGCTFHITLPVTEGDQQETGRTHARKEDNHPGR